MANSVNTFECFEFCGFYVNGFISTDKSLQEETNIYKQRHDSTDNKTPDYRIC